MIKLYIIIFILSNKLAFCSRNETKFAYASVLSSDSFAIAAKILAYQLNRISPSIPYIVVVTENINRLVVNDLRKQGVEIYEFTSIKTPCKRTKGIIKFEYTKCHLWRLENYSKIIHLDLDTLPITNIESIFNCGTFCASIRHSDMFNSGVFVLTPNKTTFDEMMRHINILESYDGGDQGFFNTFFNRLKYAPMFDERKMNQSYNRSIARLSAVYNFDVGMYYLNNGRALVEPKIIHYTMGPTKPWIWWCYPLFDLNNEWLKIRLEFQENYKNEKNFSLLKYNIFYLLAFVFATIKMNKLHHKTRNLSKLSNSQKISLSYLIYISSRVIAFLMVPTTFLPIESWVFYFLTTAWLTITASAVIIKYIAGVKPSIVDCSTVFFLINITQFLSGFLVASIWFFGHRLIMFIIVAISDQFFITFYIRKILM